MIHHRFGFLSCIFDLIPSVSSFSYCVLLLRSSHWDVPIQMNFLPSFSRVSFLLCCFSAFLLENVAIIYHVPSYYIPQKPVFGTSIACSSHYSPPSDASVSQLMRPLELLVSAVTVAGNHSTLRKNLRTITLFRGESSLTHFRNTDEKVACFVQQRFFASERSYTEYTHI